MFSILFKILFSGAVFLSIGFLSYLYLENSSMPFRDVVEKTATTSTPVVTQKSTSTKTIQTTPVVTKTQTLTKTNGTLALTATKTETVVVAPGPLRATQTGGVPSSPQPLTKEGVFVYGDLIGNSKENKPPKGLKQ